MNENGYTPEIPITLPTREERKWIKRSYNTGVGMVLLNFAIANGIAMIMLIVLATMKLIQTGMDISAAQAYIMELASSMTFPMITMNVIAMLISYPVSIGVGFKCIKARARDFLSTKNFTGKFLVLAIIVGLGVQMVGSYLANFITIGADYLGYSLATLDTTTKPDMKTNIMMGVLACIIAPLFEELLFRGLLLKTLSKSSVRFGIVASAVLFGLYHGNIPQAVNAILLGLMLGFIAYKAGSILPCIIVHFACNFNGLLQQAIVYFCGESMGAIITGIMALTFLVGAGIVLICYRKKSFSEIIPKTPPQQKRRGWSLLLTSWTTILFVIVMVGTTLMTIRVK